MNTIKKTSLLLLFIIGFSPSIWAMDCNTPSDFHILQTQALVDSFQSDYEPCDTMVGTLSVRNSDITNLNGLSAITTVTIGLTLFNLDVLPNLTGLDNLTTVGTLTINGNQLIQDLSGLNCSVCRYQYHCR